ncbi:MAG: ABC transporter permease, partial [Gammaproteobacteria bacterium]
MFFDMMESLKSALHSIRAHGFRSFLTTLGIIIGVAAVIATVSIIQGLQYTVNQQFEGLGTNSLSVQSYTSLQDRLQGHLSRVTPNDLELISTRVEGIASITPVISPNSGTLNQVRYGSQVTGTQITGSTYTYQDVGRIYMKYGRFLSDTDNTTRRRVVVIGENVRQNLSLPENPVGQFVRIGDEWVKIIGLSEERGQIFGQNQDNYAILPYSTMRTLSGNQRIPDIFIQMTFTDINMMEAIRDRVTLLLRNAHGIKEGKDDDFRVQTSDQLTSTFNNILTTVTIVMGG